MSKNEIVWIYNAVMRATDADGMERSVNPDEKAVLFLGCTVCSDVSLLILGISWNIQIGDSKYL